MSDELAFTKRPRCELETDENSELNLSENASVIPIEDEVQQLLNSRGDDEKRRVSLKIVVHNLDKNWSKKQVKQVMDKHSLLFEKISKVYKSTSGTISFASLEDKEKAKTALADEICCGKKLIIKEQEEVNRNKLFDVITKKRSLTKKLKIESSDSTKKSNVNEVVAPLNNVPYETQLDDKKKAMIKILCQLYKRTSKTFTTQKKKMVWSFVYYDHIVIPSPITEHYRNKATYTIGVSSFPPFSPSVGYVLGSTSAGETAVSSGHSLDGGVDIVSSENAERLRNVMQEFLRNEKAQALPYYDKLSHKGFYVDMMVRSFLSGENMIVISVNSSEITEEVLEAEKKKLCNLFRSLNSPKVHSFHLIDLNQKAQSEEKVATILFGEQCIHEKLFDLNFRVSKDAFFQTNSKMAEILYSKIRDCALEIASLFPKPEESILLDVCCGTGTIGQILASKVGRVYGIELCQNAVNDAIENCKLNNITNCEYIVGKAEDVISTVLSSVESKSVPVIAVVDPPRSGLHSRVLRALRQTQKLQHIVYVSCDQKSLVNDTEMLCRPQSKSIKGNPFRPIKAYTFDMFPHTEHMEALVVFERIPDEDKQGEEKSVLLTQAKAEIEENVRKYRESKKTNEDDEKDRSDK